MSITRLNFQPPSAGRSLNSERSAFLSTNLRNSYFPGKGIPFSLLIHGILFCILFFLRVPKDIQGNAHAPERVTVIQHNEPRVVMYLPLIGGGNYGMIFPAPKAPKPAQRPPVASTPKPKGLSYPGRQEIISDLPEPTNQIQTLEQPALISPPILPPPLLLPNIVQTAEVHVEPLPELLPSPEKIPEQIKPVEPPPSRPPSQIKPVEPPPVKPPPAPMPVEPPTAKPPKEEMPVEPPPAKPPEPKRPIDPPPAKPPEQPKSVEPPPVPVPVIEPEVPIVASMALPFSGAPKISVEFPKVTLPPLVPPKLEKPPALTPKLEPAVNKQIYTVYPDMRRDESDPTPSWTLEFAAFRDPSNPGNASRNIIQNQEGLILPFPIDKEPPSLPNELISKYRDRQIIVYAIINVEGKMDPITVKDSPDSQLNEPLLRALSKWVFRPAQLQGAPIAVKTLLGIPLWIPE